MIKLHNTLTRSVEDFTPLDQSRVTLYSCGPTVYDALTIGNWVAYIRWDVLARALRASDYALDWYMNITDVGHLVSDADTGEDKLEKGAKREGTTAWEIAQKYTDDFIKGLKALNIDFDLRHLVKATDHIPEQIKLIQQLEAKGYTYVIEDGVYFDSTKFADYGKMARLDIKGQQAGARVEVGDKKHGSDFALWKFSPADEQRDMEWESPWGAGFPGWHIECSAMSMKYLGNTIDIHTGGIDHIPVHHTNEIAQSEAATGQPFVHYWLHCNFLQIDNQKISKSLGNGYTLADIIKKGFTPADFRMLVLQSHYRTEANFTWEALQAARNRRHTLQAFADLRFQPLSSGEAVGSTTFSTSAEQLLNHLQDDLNTPKLLADLQVVADECLAKGFQEAEIQDFVNYLETVDDLLGLKLLGSPDISDEQKQLISRRTGARNNQDWQASDTLRDELNQQGIELNDTCRGTIWSRKQI